MYIKDTIAAISTPHGQGGIGIIRVSGDMAPVIAASLFKPVRNGGFESHRFYFGAIVDFETGEVVDEAMAVLMRAPSSYTREDVLELQCHGGSLVLEHVLGLTVRAGARLAEPGEFTKRAFLNGRIDLVQAEAVMDIIEARTDVALRLAQRQRSGALSSQFADIRSAIVKALALTEAYIDFPEDDLGETDSTAILEQVGGATHIAERLIAGYDEGRVLRDGISVLIIGKPNAGKSSLLNCLLNENRAIVTHLPGTTRDIIEETINLGGVAVRLLDTAGIRHTQDVIEQEGINRALSKIDQADLVLFVLDGSRPFENEDELIFKELLHKNVIAVVNKCDLERRLDIPFGFDGLDYINICAETGDGVTQLKDAIKGRFITSNTVDCREFVAISHVRQRDALRSVCSSLSRFREGLMMSVSLEFLAIDLRDALTSIGTLIGQVSSEELLDTIFSSFCIGK